jgi:hypothetical protein
LTGQRGNTSSSPQIPRKNPDFRAKHSTTVQSKTRDKLKYG